MGSDHSLETFRGFVPVKMLEKTSVERRPDQPVASGAGAVWGGEPSFSHSAQGRFTQPKVRAFIDFLVETFANKGPDNW